MKPHELRQKRAQIVKDARAIVTKAHEEKRQLTAEESARVDTMITEADGLEAQALQVERLESVEGAVNERGTRQGDPLPHEVPGTKHKYSLLRAIRGQAGINGERLSGLELETSQELAKRKGKSPKGFYLPLSLPMDPIDERRRSANVHNSERRALTTSAGAGSITTYLADTFIEVLRTRMVVEAAGARVLTDMVGNFAIPRQSAAGTVYWVAEGTAVTGSNQTVDQVAFGPKTAGCFTDLSRRFVEQTNLDSEAFVRGDLAAILSRGIDLAALNGLGTNQPTGILQNSGITVGASLGTNGGAPTFAAAVALETAVSNANADMGKLGYVTTAAARGTLKTTPKLGSTFPVFIWQDGEVNGYPAYVTNQLPRNLTKGTGTALSPMIFGNWEDLVLAFWSGVDILVDPYTGGTAGTLRIIMLQDVDINVRHNESFSTLVDMVTS